MDALIRILVALATTFVLSTPALAVVLCQGTVARPCTFEPTWGLVEPDGVASALSRARGGSATPVAVGVPRRVPPIGPLIAAINGASFDTRNRLVNGEQQIRSAVQMLRAVEPKRSLELKVINIPAGIGTAAAMQTRMATINRILATESPRARTAIVVGRR
jgi:hypothetical protein